MHLCLDMCIFHFTGCDAPDCKLEWFHFECVGIMVPPEGQWYCPECSKKYHYQY